MQDILDLTEIERVGVGASRLELAPGVTAMLDGIEARDIGPARFARLALSNLRVQERGGSYALASLALRDVDYAQAIIALMDIGFAVGRGTEPDLARLQGRLPRIRSVELRGLAFPVPTAEGPRPLSIGSAELGLGRWIGLVPDRVRLALGDVRVPAPLLRGVADAALPPQPGGEPIEAGGEIEVRIDAAVGTATLRPARVSVQGLGAVDVALTLGDVDTGRFGVAGLSNPRQLLEQATFRELRIRVENSGLTRRLLAAGHPSENDIQQTFLPAARQFVGNVVQDPAQAERARAALDAFARDRRSLTLVVTPRGVLSAGEIAAALQGGGPPLRLLGQVDIELTAND